MVKPVDIAAQAASADTLLSPTSRTSHPLGGARVVPARRSRVQERQEKDAHPASLLDGAVVIDAPACGDRAAAQCD